MTNTTNEKDKQGQTAESKLYTSKEVCELFGISPMTLSNWRYKGLIKAIKIGYRFYRYRKEEIDSLLKES